MQFFPSCLLRRLTQEHEETELWADGCTLGYTVNADIFLVLQDRTGQRDVLPQPAVACQLASWIFTRQRGEETAWSFGVWHWWPSATIRFGHLYKYCSLSLSPFLSLDKMLFTFSLSSPLKLGLKMQTVLMSHAFLSYTGCIQNPYSSPWNTLWIKLLFQRVFI